MTDYCYNTAVLKHPDPKMLEYVKEAFQQEKLFDAFVPIPPVFLEIGGWYDFCIENWGTRSEVMTGGYEPVIKDGQIELSFDTAYTPPLEWYNNMLKYGFEITAYYHDESSGNCGEYDNTQSVEYVIRSNNINWIKANIPEKLDNVMGISDGKTDCLYCGGNCPVDEEHACDGYLGDIDELYEI